MTSAAVAPRRYAFRVDAAHHIGNGHVMRCLTLAQALVAEQACTCLFVCRALPGHLIETIRARGHEVIALPLHSPSASLVPAGTATPADFATGWLGTNPVDDARATVKALANREFDWLIVDHYALDAAWERVVRQPGARLMVIDDLANRPHEADLLLDQNLGRLPSDYDGLLPAHCQRLIGPRHALLRPEFAALRPAALARRHGAQPHHLLITMGGVDAPDATGQVLRALQTFIAQGSHPQFELTVVLGSNALWLAQISELVTHMPCTARLLIDTPDMAKLMVQADLAIGAAGSTSWERCCLALPALTAILADNQREAAAHLEKAGATRVLALDADFEQTLRQQLDTLTTDTSKLHRMSRQAADIVDGLGVQRVVAHLTASHLPRMEQVHHA